MNMQFLEKFMSFKTISTDGAYVSELELCKGFLVDWFEQHGFQVKLFGKNSTIVLAEYGNNPELEDLLIYGHYDVQPADESGWQHDPFQLVRSKGKLWGRGIADNKGQIGAYLQVMDELIKSKSAIGWNIKFLIEGQEEISSPELKASIQDISRKINVDHILISDSTLDAENNPVIVKSFRGNIAFEVRLNSAEQEYHSGTHGGAIAPASDLATRVHNEAFTPDFLKKLNAENSLSTKEDIGETGALILTAIHSGYDGDGVKNVIPNQAILKYNYRYTFRQDGQKIAAKIRESVFDWAKENDVEVEFIQHRISDPLKLNEKTELVDKVRQHCQQVYKANPRFVAEGGSLGIVKYMEEYLCPNIVLFGLANNDCNLHAANENFDIKLYHRAEKFIHMLLVNTCKHN